MLKQIQKFFSDPKEVSMKQEGKQTDTAAPEMAAKLASTLEAMASQAEALQAVTDKLTEMSALYEGAQAALNAVEDAKAALVADAKAVRLAARKEAIVASVGTDKAESLLSATDALDDAAFKAVIGAMATTFDKEAKSPLFSEVGVSDKSESPDVAAVVEESAEAKLLKAKYNKSK